MLRGRPLSTQKPQGLKEPEESSTNIHQHLKQKTLWDIKQNQHIKGNLNSFLIKYFNSRWVNNQFKGKEEKNVPFQMFYITHLSERKTLKEITFIVRVL